MKAYRGVIICEEQNPFLSGTDVNVPCRANDLPSITIKPATSPKTKPITVKMEEESFKSGLVAAFDDDDDDEEWCDFNMRLLERYRMGNPISKNIDMVLGLWFMSAQKWSLIGILMRIVIKRMVSCGRVGFSPPQTN